MDTDCKDTEFSATIVSRTFPFYALPSFLTEKMRTFAVVFKGITIIYTIFRIL